MNQWLPQHLLFFCTTASSWDEISQMQKCSRTSKCQTGSHLQGCGAVWSTWIPRQSWDDSGRAVQLESSPSCLSSSSEQNKHFQQGLLCSFPAYFTNGKAIYAFPLPKHTNNCAGFWFQRLLEAVMSFLLRFPPSNPWLILCPQHEELPWALSCPSWATQHMLKDESDSKIKCMCLCGHVHVRGGFFQELPALKLPGFGSGHSESLFYRVTRRKNLPHQQLQETWAFPKQVVQSHLSSLSNTTKETEI